MASFYTAAQGKAKFITLCKHAGSTDSHVYVRDAGGAPALTIDPDECEDAFLVTAQFFKDNFSRCAALAKAGVVFKVKPKKGAAVWVRRHTRYVDPLDSIVAQWIAQHQKRAVDDALGAVLKKLAKIDRIDELADDVVSVRKGIERMSIGHRPFIEGRMPDAIAET